MCLAPICKHAVHTAHKCMTDAFYSVVTCLVRAYFSVHACCVHVHGFLRFIFCEICCSCWQQAAESSSDEEAWRGAGSPEGYVSFPQTASYHNRLLSQASLVASLKPITVTQKNTTMLCSSSNTPLLLYAAVQ